jgi:murein DD-endopeptidase MepM/ murein hydrolase activator NlpD
LNIIQILFQVFFGYDCNGQRLSKPHLKTLSLPLNYETTIYERMMQKIICLTFIILCISRVSVPQSQNSVPNVDSVIITNGPSIKADSSGYPPAKHDSIPEIFWNTKCIKSGWTRDNPLTDSAGFIVSDSTAPFIMPVVGNLLRGYTSYHSGWDIKLSAGAPVRAALPGRVRYAHYCSGYGNLAIIRHISGLEIYYSHLSKLKVVPNQYVKAGDTIGLGGATGHATTTHLHMEFRIFDKHFDISKIYTQNDSVIYLWKINQKSPDQPVTQNTKYHIVKKGDTLSRIAKNYNTTVANLLKLNNLKYNSILRIGQKIRIS